MEWRFMKKIIVMTLVFLLLFPNLYGNITGTSEQIDTEKNNKEDFSNDVILNAPRLYIGPADSPWPIFRHDLNHTGRSQYDTSKNDGQKKWDFTPGNYVDSSPAIGSDGTIYFGSIDHKLYALFPNGTKRWDFVTGNSVTSSPAIGSDGTIYFGSWDGKLYALYPNGTKRWDLAIGNMVSSSPAIGSDGTIYIGSWDGNLYAVFPNGTKKWDFAAGNIIVSSPAIGSDGTIYFGVTYDYKLYALFPNGTKKWNFTTGNHVFSSPAIGLDGTIYFGSWDGNLYALFPNGTKRWDYATGDSVHSSPAIGSDGTIYFGSWDEKLYAIFPNGTKRWDFATGDTIHSSPSIGSDGTIYFGSYDYYLYAVFPNGTKKWDFATGNSVYSSPAIGSDGTIYFGSWDGKFYAIGISEPTAPQDLQANGCDARVELTWKAPNNNGGSAIINYTIYRGTTSGSETFLAKVGNVTTYLDRSVTNGQKYYYEVTANNSFGESPRSNEANATPLYMGPANSPWPMFRHDLNHTGRSQYDTSKNNGQKKWEFTTNSSIRASLAIGSDGTIYVGSSDNKLYALYPNGTMKWNFTTGGSQFSSSAIGSDGTIYVGSWDHKLYALYPNGTKKWDFATGSHVESSPAMDSDGTIYFGSDDGKLYALHPDGMEKWNFTTGDGVSSSPAIGLDNTIYVGSGDHKLYALYPNGTKKWDFTTKDSVFSSPAIGSDGTIFVGSSDFKLYALYPNGSKKWDFTTDYWVDSSPAIGSDGTIYVGSSDGRIYALYPNGSKKWDFATIFSNPISPDSIGSDGTIYIGSGDGKIYALYPNGSKKWDFTTYSDDHLFPGAIGSDGTIYVGSLYSKLFAIGTSFSTEPQNLKAIGGKATVNLTWTAPKFDGASAITNYSIYRGTTTGCETFLVTIGNVTTYLDRNVTNGQKYYYEVTANNTFGESPMSNEANATPQSTPTAPLNLTAVPGIAQISLNWTKPADDGGFSITNYTVYRNGTLLKELGNVLTYTDSGLVNGVTYSYNISAINSIGEGLKSVGVNAIPRTIPSAPRSLQAPPGNAQIALMWLVPASNGGAPITNYNIYRGTTHGCETLYVQGYTGGTAWVDKNTTVGIMYYYMVSAVNVAGEGPRSNEVNITQYTVPNAPILTATAGTMKVLLNWTVPKWNGPPITNYSIYRGTTPDGETIFIKGYIGTYWVDTNITLGTTYYYRVSAVNAIGEGPKSNQKKFVAGNSPIVPTGLKASGGNARVLLKWSEPTNGGTPSKYNIYRSDTQTGNYTLIASSNTTRYVDTGLTNGHEYWYKINAQNSYGVSGNTTAISATPYGTSMTLSSLFLGLILVIIIMLIVAVVAAELSRKKKA